MFQWGNAEQKAFVDLKTLICEDQLLNFFDVTKPVVIQCDASTEGLGATLMQGGRPVLSASRSLNKSEKNYVAIELECLAISVCLSQVRPIHIWKTGGGGNRPQAPGGNCQKDPFSSPETTPKNVAAIAEIRSGYYISSWQPTSDCRCVVKVSSRATIP